MRFLIILAIAFFLAFGCGFGCNGGCIELSGTYKDAGGAVKYCFDKPASDAAGVPVMADDSGNKIFGFDIDQLKAIWDEIRGKETKGAVGALAAPERPGSHVDLLLQWLQKRMETNKPPAGAGGS